MAYGLKYILRFKNRIQNDIYRIEILEKDYADSTITILTGAETPFTVSYSNGDTDILTPIKSAEFTINFITDGSLAIEDFYSDDDEKFRMDFYFESFSDGTGTEKLLNRGFLVEDGTNEPLTDRKHIITLKATDNLALLKNVKWNEVRPDDPYFSYDLRSYIRFSLEFTGLFSFLSADSMPLVLYGNVFENSTDDREDDPSNDPYRKTHVYSGMFQNTEGEWDDCYTILTKILGSINADLIQADGCWNVRRIPEYVYFEDGAIPGTEFTFSSGEQVTPVTLDPLANIDRNGGDIQPINEDQLKSIQRPVRLVENTFNYQQPVLIKQYDLQIPSDAVPYATSTTDGIRTDKYDLATYFPDWIQRNGDGSYLVIETDTTVTPEQEKDRFIVTPHIDDVISGVQFNPIIVSKNDRLDFSLNWKTYPDDVDIQAPFWIRFLLVTDTDIYNLVQDPTEAAPPDGDPDNKRLQWEIIPDNTLWDSDSEGVLMFIVFSIASVTDLREYQAWQLSARTIGEVPLIPADGVLLIQVLGNNNNAFDYDSYGWKDINITITNFINSSIQITGHSHTSTGTSTIKAIQENDINIDDSPRMTISGTLLTDAVSSFDYIDSVTGENTDIGTIYFTPTVNWHRPGITEYLRLGDILTQERIQLNYTARTIIEGTFKNCRIDETRFVSPLNLFRFGFINGKSFIAASLELDYMANTFQANLIEIIREEEAHQLNVFMTGTKGTQTGLLNGAIQYDSVGYYGGAETYLTPSLSNSRFTYTGFDTSLIVSATLNVPISGTGTATFTLEKNGVAIDTQTVNASEVFKRIDFDLTEDVTDLDYFEIVLNNGGADVDIQSASLNITVNGVMSTTVFPYQFKYIYKTD